MKELQSLVGRLPTDFFDIVENETPFINMGLLGLLSYGYILIVGGNVNGPMIAGMATVMGFGSFGKSMKNSYPLVIGVIIATLLFGKSLNAPGPMLAALFSTTLAPIAGLIWPYHRNYCWNYSSNCSRVECKPGMGDLIYITTALQEDAKCNTCNFDYSLVSIK